MRTIIGFAILAASACWANAAYCNGKPDPSYSPNINPIYQGDPVFVRNVTNGKLYMGGVNDTMFRIVHVWGSPYEMGFAHGSLLSADIVEFMTELWLHLEQEIINRPKWLPPSVADYLARVGLDAALEATELATQKYTPPYWAEEIRGLVDGVNHPSVKFRDVLWVTLFGELTKGTCSMFGAWGDALKNVPNINLFQLRALDWDTDGPFPKYPAIVVYHPDQGHAFANVGWTGWVGSITGMSSNQMAISEIGVYFFDDTWGTESRFGYPFTYMLRDVLQFDNTTEDAATRFINSERTCYLLFGVGDGKNNEFRGFQSSHAVLNEYDDMNLQPNNETWHARIKDVVYWAMDWNCPGYNVVLNQQLNKYYGNLTPEITIQEILPALQTGDTHIAIYDLTNNYMFYSAIGLANTPNRNAYQRPFTRLDMTKLFAIQRP
eukprot:TRINITY_DN4323_c0_g1_i1.p1 TRINITY_DN4323_c0_g1~~TRINITY_DN4323_c0_g1_i1.p1  ORF type:complete len:435 (-),score=118.03 TRINITY_DN4323_c0_g1_i1:71-1375(-)